MRRATTADAFAGRVQVPAPRPVPSTNLQDLVTMSYLRMPPLRASSLLLASVLFGSSLPVVSGCGAEPTDEEIGEDEGELGSSPKSAGLKPGSLEEEGVLLLVNDRSVTVDVLRARTKVTATVAKSIVAYRTDTAGAPRWFETIDQIDALPSTGKVTFQRLVADAKQSGYVEASGFDAPTQARLAYPDNLGRPPTSADITVEAGFDGKSPAEVGTVVRGRLMNTVDSSNERFVAQTIADTHKAFTIAVGNMFAQGSPHARFASSLGAESLTMLGTMSALKPTILVAVKDGRTTYYARGASGSYEAIETPRYPIIMRARIQLGTEAKPQGVRLFYPAWSAKVLTGPTTTIYEGGEN